MERELIINEYIQLRNFLNRTNKLSDEKTELKFEIQQFKLFEYRFYAISESQHETHKIALAERSRTKNWERTGFTNFRNLEEFLAYELNEFESREKSPEKRLVLPSTFTNEMTIFISNILNNLLLKPLYEP